MRPFVYCTEGGDTYLVCPVNCRCVVLDPSREWTLTGHTNDESGELQYVLDTSDHSTDVKPKWAHVLLSGKKAVDVDHEEVLAEIKRRLVNLKQLSMGTCTTWVATCLASYLSAIHQDYNSGARGTRNGG